MKAASVSSALYTVFIALVTFELQASNSAIDGNFI
jgi:hypothetical protein